MAKRTRRLGYQARRSISSRFKKRTASAEIDWGSPKNRYRCTSCGTLCKNKAALVKHYMACWTWYPPKQRKKHIKEHLSHWTYDIVGGTKYSVEKGRVKITPKDKSLLRKWYVGFGLD